VNGNWAKAQLLKIQRCLVVDDIDRVRKADAQRRPVDLDAIQERQRIIAALREIVNYGTVEELKDAMRAFGLSEKKPEWAAALRIWNAERGQT